MLHIAIPTIQIGGTIRTSIGSQGHLITRNWPSTLQALSLEQAILNLNKVVGDFVADRNPSPINSLVKRLICLHPNRAKPRPSREREEEENKGEIKGAVQRRRILKLSKFHYTMQVPVKYEDPGYPTISVMIGETCVEKALLDLGANRSVKIPRGMIEDVLVQVDKNGVMQLTFGNMTLELNIFYMCNKQFHPGEEEGLEEVFACYSPPLKMREEILILFNEEETQEAVKEEHPKLIQAITHGVKVCILGRE
ncbi:hypothetical protein AAG906_013070 [Vitis piasezkii]